jgi:hypothetical protein
MEDNVMRNVIIPALSAVLIGFVGAAMTPASAAPLGNPAPAVHRTTDPADTALVRVGWRYGYRGYGWRGWYGGYYPYRYYYGGYYPRYRYYGYYPRYRYYGYYPRYRYYGYYPRYRHYGFRGYGWRRW